MFFKKKKVMAATNVNESATPLTVYHAVSKDVPRIGERLECTRLQERQGQNNGWEWVTVSTSPVQKIDSLAGGKMYQVTTLSGTIYIVDCGG